MPPARTLLEAGMLRGTFQRWLGVACVSMLATACAAESVEDQGASSGAISTSDPAYAEGPLHSTLTPAVVASLKSVLASSHGDTRRFIKVGDSITFSNSFLDCLTSHAVSDDLEATRQYFAETTGSHTPDGPETSWDRRTKSAVVGWHTTQPLAGSPSPLESEIAEMNPAFAIVMLGTNDNDPTQVSGCKDGLGHCAYRTNIEKVVDALLAKKVIPLLSTIPPRGNSASADARVPSMNDIVRSVAAERKIPLMDFHRAIQNLPAKGLGADGIHPSVSSSTGACDLSASGLTHGYNVRNHLVLEALDQVRAALLGKDADDGIATGAPAPTTDPAPTTEPTDGAIPTATLQSVDDYSVIATSLHCRDAAGIDARIVETIPNGAIIPVVPDATRVQTDATGAPWLHVTAPSGATCYVSANASYLSPI